MTNINQKLQNLDLIYNIVFKDVNPTELEDTKISLFVCSKNNQAIKKLDLDKLTPEQRIAKLNKYAEKNRLVAVIEKGDYLCALMCSDNAKQFANQEKPLTIEGRKVEVKGLSDQEYCDLTKISLAIRNVIETDKKQNDVKPQVAFSKHRGDLADTKLQEIRAIEFIGKIENIPGKIKQRLLDQWSENIKAIAEQKKAKNKQEDAQQTIEKAKNIKEMEIKKQNGKLEIVKEAIKSDNQKRETSQT